jgi:hypothetical protein
MNPRDLYQLATANGTQIRLDAVRFDALDFIDFGPSTGSAVKTSMLVEDQLYVLFADEACIVRFDGVADKDPVGTKAVLLDKDERATGWLPVGATGFSVIGLTATGRLHIQRITTWAGLADTMENQ